MAVTSGKTWREAREKGIEIELISGNSVALRPIELDFFLRVGHVPSALASVLNDAINGKAYKLEVPEQERAEQSEEWIKFLNELVTFAFVNPKVVDAPQADDEISIDDVSYQDKLEVYGFFTRPARMLRSFRDKQTGNVAVVAPTAVNRKARKQVVAPEFVGDETNKAT
jgi:hypothetical protein